MPFIIHFRHCGQQTCWVNSDTGSEGPITSMLILVARQLYHYGSSAGSCMNMPCGGSNPQTLLQMWSSDQWLISLRLLIISKMYFRGKLKLLGHLFHLMLFCFTIIHRFTSSTQLYLICSFFCKGHMY